ncbi:cell cycle checkpoint control protein rad9a [Mortierella sp. NVP85]|nr:cell cycle checkpoint control protein rad9a [Mortierella sp. NVP85]
MTRLVDRLQEMTAPPPPMAMRTAYRQQEQRRQKLFVGEYSMREGNSHGGGSRDGGKITIMGTNPFRRSPRTQGSVAGGWGEKKVNDMSRSGARSPGPDLATTSRTFPLARTSSRTISFRNGTSEAIYGLAPHIQTSVVRSTLQARLFQESVVGEQATASYGDLLGGALPSLSTKESRIAEIGQDLLFWGTAKDICDVVSETLRQDKKSNPLVDPFEETIALTPSQGSSTLTGLVRDMIDWIEQEDWERRLRYLFVLDALLTYPGIASEFLNCSALPVLLETLTGPLCEQATQRSVRELSKHLAHHIKQAYGKSLLSKVAAEVSDGGMQGFHAVLTCLSKIGDDIIVEARPDRFTMSTISVTRSAFASFIFTRTFFESYNLDTASEAIRHDADGPYLRCSVLARALVSACKLRGKIALKFEKCCLTMDAAEGVGENCRLTVENVFKQGVTKIHKLLYESCPEPLEVLDSIRNYSSSWRLPATAMAGFTENFSSKAEEISMTCQRDAITFKTMQQRDGPSEKRIATTEFPMSKDVMDVYNLQDEIELTFSMREFKAIIAFALTLRLPLTGHFDARNRPLLLSMESEGILLVNFALATVIDEDDIRKGASSEQSSTIMGVKSADTTHTEIDLSQPENALFLDDGTDWAGALNDLVMEEEAAAKQQILQQQPPQQNGIVANRNVNSRRDTSTRPGTESSSASTSRTAGTAYEIEEGFLPAVTQRQTKRTRFILADSDDEDD